MSEVFDAVFENRKVILFLDNTTCPLEPLLTCFQISKLYSFKKVPFPDFSS